MKKLAVCLMLSLLLILYGCSGKAETVWETVDDELPAAEVSYLDEAYSIKYDVPEDAVVETFSPASGRSIREHPDGDYAITSEVFLSSGAEETIRRLSGFEPEELRVVMTERYGMPEYQFAWYAGGDEGGYLYRTDVLMDDLYCYALTFGVREGLGNAYDSTSEQVFSSFSLFYDEGV